MSIEIAPSAKLLDGLQQYAGRIHFGDWQVRVPCIVKEVSGTSATLSMFGANQLPNLFWLSIQDLGLHEECQLIAKTNRTAKVRFGKSKFHQTSIRGHNNENLDHLGSTKPNSCPRLWVVEDDEDDRSILNEAFRDNGVDCDIQFFKDGIHFLDHIKNLNVENSSGLNQVLTLIDINMPRMDGITTLQNLRQIPICANLPVMVFSTSESDNDVRRAYDLGIEAYLPKPNTHDDMENIVQFISQYWQVNLNVSG